MNAILISVLVLGALGLVFGIMLMVANKVFEMPANPTRDAVRNALPGANCGGCGFAGCDGYAEALVNIDGTKTNLCIPGADKVSQDISDILGVEFADVVEMVAFVSCNGNCAATSKKFEYDGIDTIGNKERYVVLIK